jgi:hypothetical protein
MAQLITERVKNLRNEIAKLSEANRAYLKGPKYGAATADNERRLQRLLEIADELKSEKAMKSRLNFLCHSVRQARFMSARLDMERRRGSANCR